MNELLLFVVTPSCFCCSQK